MVRRRATQPARVNHFVQKVRALTWNVVLAAHGYNCVALFAMHLRGLAMILIASDSAHRRPLWIEAARARRVNRAEALWPLNPLRRECAFSKREDAVGPIE